MPSRSDLYQFFMSADYPISDSEERDYPDGNPHGDPDGDEVYM